MRRRGGLVGRAGLVLTLVAALTAACDREVGVNEGWHTNGIATPAAVPAVVGESVVVASDEGGLAGLDAVSGEIEWRWEAPREIEPVVAAAGDAIVVSVPGQQDPRLCLVAAADGVERWCREVDAPAMGMAGLGAPLLGGTGDTIVTSRRTGRPGPSRRPTATRSGRRCWRRPAT